MSKKFNLKILQSGQEYLEMTDENGHTWGVPFDPANSDYQRYLRWLENPNAEEGGTL